MSSLVHFFGKKVDGKLGRFFGSYSEEEFETIMNKLDGTLPKDFVAWHMDWDEVDKGSKRIDEMKKIPLITEFSPFVITGETYADAEKALLRAKEREALE